MYVYLLQCSMFYVLWVVNTIFVKAKIILVGFLCLEMGLNNYFSSLALLPPIH